MKLKKLSTQELEQYHRDGYVLARGVASPDLLGLARSVLNRWMDQTIEGWISRGLLRDSFGNEDMEHRLVKAWEAAGRPAYIRSPRRDIVCPETYAFLSHPNLLDLAEDLLGEPDIYLHGVFNARPKAPDQKWTDTPWHQDAQYFPDGGETHIVTMWIPLQPVTEKNSCLQVASGLHRGPLHENYEDKETGFIGLTPDVQRTLMGISIEMQPGDVLCFTQKTPHRALPNLSDAMRWSMDLRYEAASTATEHGRKLGFLARSRTHPQTVQTYEQWLKKWEGIPLGAY